MILFNSIKAQHAVLKKAVLKVCVLLDVRDRSSNTAHLVDTYLSPCLKKIGTNRKRSNAGCHEGKGTGSSEGKTWIFSKTAVLWK